MPLSRENDNALENLGLYEDKKSILEMQDIEKDYRNFMSKSSNTGIYIKDNLSRHTPHNRLLANELSSFVKEVRFSK